MGLLFGQAHVEEPFAPVQGADGVHLGVGQGEIEDVDVVRDVPAIRVLGDIYEGVFTQLGKKYGTLRSFW